VNDHALRVLEFEKIKEKLTEFAHTQGGRDLVFVMLPTNSAEEVARLQRETSQCKNQLLRYGPLPFIDAKSITDYIKSCVIGSPLSPEELLEVLKTLRCSRSVKSSLEGSREDIPDVWVVASRIKTQQAIEQMIAKTVDEHGEVLDSASERLASIRVQMRLVHTKIQSKLGEIMRSSSYSKMIQDPIITIRDDRYVIPLKSEYKNHFPCIVHDSSASGQTLYVEPLSVIPLNNDLRNLRLREREEIAEILRRISDEISMRSEDMEVIDEALSGLDFMFARAELSIRWNCTEPAMEDGHRLNIRGGRHPLISEPIPIDIRIGSDFKMIILTGPNTGGKTASLKTVGLFVVMAQCGLHLPCEDGTEMGILDDVLLDIGDEQSLTQNLSTFSSHLKNISLIIGDASSSKLVLLDELGAGTDPTEGASLAYAIAEHFYAVGCPTIITTHIGEMKGFAYNNINAVNASVGFDHETLMPTYKIHIGTPGSSHAFEIAERTGLPDLVISRARALMRPEDKNSADIISKMAEDAKMIMEEREQVSKARMEAEELLRKREVELVEIEQNRKSMLDRELLKARKFFGEKLAEADEIVKRLAKASRQNKETDTLQKRLQEIHEEVAKAEEEQPSTTPVDVEGIKAGDIVYVPRFKSQGVVMDVYPEKGKVLVQVGTARVQLPASSVELVNEPVEGEEIGKPEVRPEVQSVPIKLELFGMPIEDALVKLERYLDSAYSAGMPFVYIVHGRGSGVLRKAIQDYLPHCPRVDRFNLAQPDEGGDAVTIVFLK